MVWEIGEWTLSRTDVVVVVDHNKPTIDAIGSRDPRSTRARERVEMIRRLKVKRPGSDGCPLGQDGGAALKKKARPGVVVWKMGAASDSDKSEKKEREKKARCCISIVTIAHIF